MQTAIGFDVIAMYDYAAPQPGDLAMKKVGYYTYNGLTVYALCQGVNTQHLLLAWFARCCDCLTACTVFGSLEGVSCTSDLAKLLVLSRTSAEFRRFRSLWSSFHWYQFQRFSLLGHR